MPVPIQKGVLNDLLTLLESETGEIIGEADDIVNVILALLAYHDEKGMLTPPLLVEMFNGIMALRGMAVQLFEKAQATRVPFR